MQDFLSSSNTSQGVVITRLNYNRPKWFGGFFGSPEKHNKSGNCVYDADAMAKIITPQNLNKLVEPLYKVTPFFAYHVAITAFVALSIILTLLQQGFNYLISFGFISSVDPNNYYLRTLGIIWYVVWGVGFFSIIPLYFVSLQHVENYFISCENRVFGEMRVRVRVKKDAPNKFLFIDGFKKIDSLEIVSV